MFLLESDSLVSSLCMEFRCLASFPGPLKPFPQLRHLCGRGCLTSGFELFFSRFFWQADCVSARELFLWRENDSIQRYIVLQAEHMTFPLASLIAVGTFPWFKELACWHFCSCLQREGLQLKRFPQSSFLHIHIVFFTISLDFIIYNAWSIMRITFCNKARPYFNKMVIKSRWKNRWTNIA